MEKDNLSILVVENDPDTLDLYSLEIPDALKSLGIKKYELTETNSGIKALDFIEKNNPDVIFLDYYLPGGLTGLEVYIMLSEEQKKNVIFNTVSDMLQYNIREKFPAEHPKMMKKISTLDEFIDILKDYAA